jgi:hypothetical protein
VQKRSAEQKKKKDVQKWNELNGMPIWMRFASATLKASISAEAPRKRSFSRRKKSGS